MGEATPPHSAVTGSSGLHDGATSRRRGSSGPEAPGAPAARGGCRDASTRPAAVPPVRRARPAGSTRPTGGPADGSARWRAGAPLAPRRAGPNPTGQPPAGLPGFGPTRAWPRTHRESAPGAGRPADPGQGARDAARDGKGPHAAVTGRDSPGPRASGRAGLPGDPGRSQASPPHQRWASQGQSPQTSPGPARTWSGACRVRSRSRRPAAGSLPGRPPPRGGRPQAEGPMCRPRCALTDRLASVSGFGWPVDGSFASLLPVGGGPALAGCFSAVLPGSPPPVSVGRR